MLERDITTRILRYLKTVPHCFCWKQHGGQYGMSGLPDIICCINGIFVAFEVKTNTGKLSELQKIAIRRIKEAGGVVFVARCLDDVKSILSEVENECSVEVSEHKSGGDQRLKGLLQHGENCP